MQKLLVTCQIPKEGIHLLFENFNVTYPDKVQLHYKEILSVIKDYEILLAVGMRADKEMLDEAVNLKYIANFGVGYDSIDVSYATKKNIVVSNTPATVTEATAELGFGLMHAVARRITECDHKLRTDPELRWGLMMNLGHTLYGKTLGILGMGRIGRALARRAIASGMKIIYYNRNRLDIGTENEFGAQYVTMEELFKNSDIVSISVPLSDASYHLVGESELSLMKSSAIIINTARGSVIDEKILIKYLSEKRIAGAGLDVFENEPKINKDFFSLDNVVITPHIGTASIESRIEMGYEVSKNIIDYVIHGKPTNVVNPEVLKK